MCTEKYVTGRKHRRRLCDAIALGKIWSHWPNVAVGHIMNTISQSPHGAYSVNGVQARHVLAGLLLCRHLRLSCVHELLRVSKHGLRRMHTFS